MARRICLDCGTLTDGTRCTTCRRPRERAMLQAKRQRRPRPTHAEDKRRAAAVAAHRREHGDWCPGWRRDPHEASDLTADHVDAVAAGGAESGDLQVLCRSCNSAKGAR
ncbi:HNH endonuclease [Micromonospora krabiensis]|uniref:HNH endonuclease n=2 Tax=Micromonospora krabiensis TaxID=307121 RepID=UPI000B87D62A